jgi:hypothetical protein
MATPTWPCTLSGCSAIELLEPPTSTLPPTPTPSVALPWAHGVVAGEIAGAELRDRREHAPRQRGFLGDAEVEPNLADGRDIKIVGPVGGAQHTAEIGDRADDESDAGAAATFEDADLHASLLGAGAGDERGQGKGDTGKEG